MISEVTKPAYPRLQSTGIPDEAAFSATAEEIASDLLQGVACAPDGGMSWSLVRHDAHGLEHKPLGPYLGSGVLGVAVFLAGLDRVRGGRDHRDACLLTVARLRRDIGRRLDLATPVSRRHAPGGMFGMGSVIYGLTVLANLLRDASLLAEAADACKLLDASELRREDRLDVVFGLSGLLLALLALDRSLEGSSTASAVADGLPLELATVCAERLTGLRDADPSSSTLSTPGYSHGASGVAHALTAFAARTGDRAAREAADAWLEEAGRQLAATSPRRGSWCNGIAGHGIARVADAATREARSAAPSPALFSALETAPAAHDHLCCGWSGRADVLLHSARLLGEPELEAAARRIGSALVRRHRERGLRFPHPEIRFDPRLLRGPVGVGYSLLRLCAPETLPCLLAFE